MRGAPSFFKLFASSRGRRAAMPPFRARANQGDACGQVSARDGSPPRRPDRRSRKVYRQVLSRDPAHANAAFLLGAIALGSGRTDAAVEALRRAIELEPTNAYHANLGEAYRRLGSYSQAIASFETAISIKPDFAEPAFNLGLLMEKAGELEVALACFERAAQSKPDSAAIARQLEVARAKHTASSRERNGDSGGGHDLAIQAWLALAAGRRLLGRFDEAVALCRRALAYDPRRVATLLRLAEVLAEAGLTDEAVDRLGLAREIRAGPSRSARPPIGRAPVVRPSRGGRGAPAPLPRNQGRALAAQLARAHAALSPRLRRRGDSRRGARLGARIRRTDRVRDPAVRRGFDRPTEGFASGTFRRRSSSTRTVSFSSRSSRTTTDSRSSFSFISTWSSPMRRPSASESSPTRGAIRLLFPTMPSQTSSAAIASMSWST